MRRILDVDPQLELKIEGIINAKGFRDFHHFATIALENQVAWETGDITGKGITNALDLQISQLNKAVPPRYEALEATLTANENLLRMPSQKPKLSHLPIPENANNILWGQYYRFLPVKVGVRVLLNLYTEHLPELRDFTEKVTNVVLPFRHQLAKLDRMDRRSFGELLSATFPTNDEKSIKRFVNQYILHLRTSDMTLLGMMPELKLINVISDENGIVKIGLTNFGSQFALLQNPVIDLTKPESLSGDEINFLLNHIADNLPAEFEHMTIALKAIENGKNTRDELNAALKGYYLHYHKGSEWSDTVINTMRSGLFSRLNELGLVRREKNGKYIRYHITAVGKKYVQSMSEKDYS
ncbi:MAG TPA: hypothetical protein VFY68_02730 [Nitrososphaeraceae archaeon]|nr:hypothetical protein [Nitrososphaeraceae archaeon]